MQHRRNACFFIALSALPWLPPCGAAESAFVPRLCPAFATLVTFLPRLLHGSEPAGACGDRGGTSRLGGRAEALSAETRSPMEDPAAVAKMLAFPGNLEVSGVVARRKTVGKSLTFVTLEVAGCEIKSLSQAAAPTLSLPIICKFENVAVPKTVKKGERISVECVDDPDSTAIQALRWEDGSAPPARVQAVAPAVELGVADGSEQTAGHTILMQVDGWKGSLCRDWVRSGCEDPKCACRHEYLPGEKDVVERQDRQAAEARAEAQDEEDPHVEGGKEGKGKHNRLFVAWLLETFGVEHLRSAGGVVDIAGGTGGISEILELEYGVPCTLIDPRPLRLSAQRRRRIRKLSTKRPAASDVLPALDDRLGLTLESEPRGPLAPLDEPQVDAVSTVGAWGPGGLRGAPFKHIVELFPGEDGGEGLAAAARASVVIGMHSDDATEPIVDAALRLAKPFAVVPCCVFPTRHPQRRTPEGKKVINTNDFVKYLHAKGPHSEGGHIQVEYLGFEGRNKVVFSLGK